MLRQQRSQPFANLTVFRIPKRLNGYFKWPTRWEGSGCTPGADSRFAFHSNGPACPVRGQSAAGAFSEGTVPGFFLDSLWSNVGGFHGHWQEDHIDPDYAAHGLLALGHLSVSESL